MKGRHETTRSVLRGFRRDNTIAVAFAGLSKPTKKVADMTPEEAAAAQDWAGMNGVTAWHLISRHADNWDDIGAMMDSWLRANVNLALKAKVCLEADGFEPIYKD